MVRRMQSLRCMPNWVEQRVPRTSIFTRLELEGLSCFGNLQLVTVLTVDHGESTLRMESLSLNFMELERQSEKSSTERKMLGHAVPTTILEPSIGGLKTIFGKTVKK